MDDLDLPVESDPVVFAKAFLATRRNRGASMRSRNQPHLMATDDCGLPAEGDPGDFARAFVAVHCQGYVAQR